MKALPTVGLLACLAISGTLSAQGPAMVYSYNAAVEGYEGHHIRIVEDGQERIISPSQGTAWNATFMPGGRILYSLYHGDECQIYSTNRDGTDTRQLTTAEGLVAFHPMASADGRWVTFTRYDQRDIGLLDRQDGSIKTVAPFEGYDDHPVFFQDSNRILFGSRRDSGPNGEPGIYIYDIENDEVTHTGFYGYYARPSHDGTMITYGANEVKDQENPDIYVATLGDVSSARQLTDNDFYEGHPSFAPGDQRIIYVSRVFQAADFPRDQESDTAGTNEVVSMNLNGADLKRLSFEDAVAWHPEFDPRGSD